MGLPMVQNLAKAGHSLTVWNRSQEKAHLVSDVAAIVEHPADVARATDVTIAMLSDGPVTESILLDGGVIEGASTGHVLIDMGSIEPDRDRRLHDIADKRGVHYIDAPVSGGVAGAKAGTLAILAGGKAEAIAMASPVFDAMGRYTHVGPIGAGQTVKLANQLIVATTIGAVAEAFKLAESAGCDPATVRHALRGGFAESRILELHGARMAERDFEPGGKSWSQLKDLRNAATVRDEADLTLPLSETITNAFADLVDKKEGGEYDHAAYYLWLELLGAPKPK